MAIVNSLSAKANDDYHLNISVNFIYLFLICILPSSTGTFYCGHSDL